MNAPVVTRAPAFTLGDILQAFEAAQDYFEARFVFCPDCRKAADGLCRDHDEDSRLAFTARALRDAAAGSDPAALAALVAALSGTEGGNHA